MVPVIPYQGTTLAGMIVNLLYGLLSESELTYQTVMIMTILGQTGSIECDYPSISINTTNMHIEQ